LEISKIGCNFGCKFQRLHPNINNMNIKRNIIFALEGRKKDGILRTEDVPIRMRVVYEVMIRPDIDYIIRNVTSSEVL